MRYLVKVRVYYDGKDTWTMNGGDDGVRVFKGDGEAFAKLLRKLQAKDNFKDPKSLRSMPYKQIVNEIINGTDNTIYIWSNLWPDKGKIMKMYKGE